MGLVALTTAWMQIRLHVAHLDHPILGDDMYGLQVSPVRIYSGPVAQD